MLLQLYCLVNPLLKLTFEQVNFVWAHTFKTVALFCIFTQQCSTMVVKIQCHWNPDLIKELKSTRLENERGKWRLLHLRKRIFSWTVLSFSCSSVSREDTSLWSNSLFLRVQDRLPFTRDMVFTQTQRGAKHIFHKNEKTDSGRGMAKDGFINIPP